MRLVSFQAGAGPVRLGALVDGVAASNGTAVVDLLQVEPGMAAFESMRALMHAGDAGLDAARRALERAVAQGRTLALADVRLRPPLRPTLIRDFATMDSHMRNYLRLRALERAARTADPQAHMEAERRNGKLDLPGNWLSVYQHHIGNPLNVIGHDDALTRPRGVAELDYELELAAVVGRTGADVSPAQAARHIFGYVLMNDFTARDIQRAEAKAAGKSKDFDGSYSIGPCIVTRDALPVHAGVALRAVLNGELQSQDNTRSMQIPFEQLLAYVSRSCTVHAGELLASGTFALGCGFELGRMLADGDVVELQADGLGTLRNTVLPTPAASPLAHTFNPT